jgi:hypothetical protein
MPISVLNQHPPLNELPDNYCIALSSFSAITLTGEESVSYLQGQVTCDVKQLSDSSLITGAHCDAKGKVYSVFRLFQRQSALWLLQPKATLPASLAALKKFGVFAKATIEEQKNQSCYAVIGKQASTLIKQYFLHLPDSMSPVIECDGTTIIYITSTSDDKQCYLIINENNKVVTAINALSLPVYNTSLWNSHEVLAGFPLLGENAVGEYVPQMLNLQAINGISFTKGCYLGQETVARMQYLGRNKRALFILSGFSTEKITLEDAIEQQLGDNWRSAGKLLSFYQADNGEFFLQAVLANNIDNKLRLNSDNKHFCDLTVIELPYSLKQE